MMEFGKTAIKYSDTFFNFKFKFWVKKKIMSESSVQFLRNTVFNVGKQKKGRYKKIPIINTLLLAVIILLNDNITKNIQ